MELQEASVWWKVAAVCMRLLKRLLWGLMGSRSQQDVKATEAPKYTTLLYNDRLIKEKGLILRDYEDVTELGDVLGAGGQGKVELGVVKTLDGTNYLVAIKKVSARKEGGRLADQRRLAGDIREEFEIQLAVSDLEGCDRLFGPFLRSGARKGDKFYAVMEFQEKGSLLEFMREHADTLSWDVKLSLLWDIARTMQAVNSSTTADGKVQPTIHGDLKSGNILLYEDAKGRLRAKICDWGSARRDWTGSTHDHLADATFTAKTVTRRWAPPEAQRDCPTYFVKSDVYTFAMIMLETAIKELPWEREGRIGLKDGQELMAMLDHDMKATSSSAAHECVQSLLELPVGYRDLMEDCCQFEPDQRPGWQTVVERLEGMMAALCKAGAQDCLQ